MVAYTSANDACSVACSQFIIANPKDLAIKDLSVQCAPQRLMYADEFALSIAGIHTVYPSTSDLQPGESTVVHCGFVAGHFAQPGYLLFSLGDPLDPTTRIIRTPVDSEGKPIVAPNGNIASAKPIRGGQGGELGQEIPLLEGDVVFTASYKSWIWPFGSFRKQFRFVASRAQSGEYSWIPTPVSAPPLPEKRTHEGYRLVISDRPL